MLVDTLDRFVALGDEAIDPQVVRLLRARLARSPAKAIPLRQTLAACEDMLVAARVRAAGWWVCADGWEALDKGFAKTLKACRRAMQDLARTGDPACSHEWRKRVKHHWHHVRLLRGIMPGPAEERAKAALKLADLLGERHDLDLFVETLATQPRRSSDAATMDRLTALARKRIARLEEKARKLGKDLFDERPRKLADKWGERWAHRARQEELA